MVGALQIGTVAQVEVECARSHYRPTEMQASICRQLLHCDVSGCSLTNRSDDVIVSWTCFRQNMSVNLRPRPAKRYQPLVYRRRRHEKLAIWRR